MGNVNIIQLSKTVWIVSFHTVVFVSVTYSTNFNFEAERFELPDLLL